MRKSAFLLCLTLAACGPRVTPVVQGDPTAAAALLAMPETQFFAQSQIAQQIAGKCATIGYNKRFSDAVAVQRFGDEAAQISTQRDFDPVITGVTSYAQLLS